MTPSESAHDTLDQATAEMLSALAAAAKMLMQADPADELSDELWEACLRAEQAIGKVRTLRAGISRPSEPGSQAASGR